MLVGGADACPGGWVFVALQDGEVAEALVVPALVEALDRWPDLAAAGVDIPVGLPEGGRRRADVEARRFVGARRSSVWFTPGRTVLESPWAAGLGVSRQAHGMRSRIFEVEALAGRPLYEVHPEVTFRFLAGTGDLPAKRTWDGVRRRLRLLEAAGIHLPDAVGPGAAPDDLLDAAAIAWSAGRIARGEAATLPAAPGRGEPVIWY